MPRMLRPHWIPALLAASCALAAHAVEPVTQPEGHSVVIALKTNDFELGETEVSDLAVGESKTIVTDGGKTIDLLRNEDGIEIYVDGELIEMDIDPDKNLHAGQHLSEDIEIVCTDDRECQDMVWIQAGAEAMAKEAPDGGGVHVIRSEIQIECDDGENCSEQAIVIANDPASLEILDGHDGDSHVIRLHQSDDNEQHPGKRKIIVIRQHEEVD